MIFSTRKIILIVLLTLNYGCTSSKVYLFARYLEPEQVKSLESQLTEQGFSVESNQVEFPSDIQENTLVHSLTAAPNEIHRIIQTSQQLDFDGTQAQIYALHGKHFFSNGGFGLYLFSNGLASFNDITRPQHTLLFSKDLIGSYRSKHGCKNRQSLELLNDQTFKFSEFVQLDNFQIETLKSISGRWRLEKGRLLLMTTSGAYELAVVESKITESQYIRHIRTIRAEVSNSPFCDLHLSILEAR